MKARINKKGKWVAVYWPKLVAWDFYRILATGQPSKHQPNIIAFTTDFWESVRAVRKDHKEVPAGGWDKISNEVEADDRFTLIAKLYKSSTT